MAVATGPDHAAGRPVREAPKERSEPVRQQEGPRRAMAGTFLCAVVPVVPSVATGDRSASDTADHVTDGQPGEVAAGSRRGTSRGLLGLLGLLILL
ncbi:hypothetical protein SAMN04487819_104326 [Actinopolyspora alba]|uniref:Uncharacterized protein n=1 Tax=Actinopolyspora alba TaxID=673379 RepID=A0A1I1W0W0_9ACTN|nr:hypothetical protein SAMN04487819_104326 [Actinopolyspora alba]